MKSEISVTQHFASTAISTYRTGSIVAFKLSLRDGDGGLIISRNGATLRTMDVPTIVCGCTYERDAPSHAAKFEIVLLSENARMGMKSSANQSGERDLQTAQSFIASEQK